MKEKGRAPGLDMAFKATSCPVRRLFARKTVAVAPLPSSSPMSYFRARSSAGRPFTKVLRKKAPTPQGLKEQGLKPLNLSS